MLNIIIRELNREFQFATRPLRNMRRSKSFMKSEPSAIDATAGWKQSNLVKADVDALQETSRNVVFVNYHKSKGSFVTDVDGHVLLDLSSTETLPLGHNHDELLKVSEFLFNSNS